MKINESISLDATLIGKDSNDMDLPIVTVNGIQTQLNEFLNAMRNRMTELNYKLTI